MVTGAIDSVLKESTCTIYMFQGVFSTRDRKKYFQFPFRVNKHASKIHLRLEYNKEPGNNLYLQLYDYRKFRGIGKCAVDGKKQQIEIVITLTQASPGAIFGNLPKGRWIAEIDANEIFTVCRYNLMVEVHYDTAKINRYAIKKPRYKDYILTKEQKWYKGDLHIHSSESDGTESVKDIVQAARKANLNFIAITDHNTISPWQYYKKYKDILLIPAMEISTHHGHANALGLQEWVDWRLGYRNRDMNDIIKDTHMQGALFSINHPGMINHRGEKSFRLQDVDLNCVDCIEIWNAPWTMYNMSSNKQSRDLWTKLLNEGYRLTALAGSDLHSLDSHKKKIGYLINYVYSENLSQVCLLKAIQQGRVFMTLGPEIYFTAEYEASVYMIGDVIKKKKEKYIKFLIRAINVSHDMEIHVIKDGQLFERYNVENENIFVADFEDLASEEGWYRVEIHNKITDEEEDSLQAITNPIYVSI